MRLLSLKSEGGSMNSKYQVFQAAHFIGNISLCCNPVLVDGNTHLFELLNLIFQTVDSVNQAPAGTEKNNWPLGVQVISTVTIISLMHI